MLIDGCLVILDADNLHANLIEEAHHCLGHLGYAKTIAELQRDFFWPKMAKEVSAFVRLRSVCQRTKAPNTAPTGKMLTPEFPRIPLQDIAIDFVGPLKSSGHYDMLLSCTCRLSGFTGLIPTLQKDTAEKTASRFFTGWLATFGAPKSIISDRDKTWDSKFWKALMAHTSTQFHRSSVFHPQADGRSERTNKTVGRYSNPLQQSVKENGWKRFPPSNTPSTRLSTSPQASPPLNSFLGEPLPYSQPQQTTTLLPPCRNGCGPENPTGTTLVTAFV